MKFGDDTPKTYSFKLESILNGARLDPKDESTLLLLLSPIFFEPNESYNKGLLISYYVNTKSGLIVAKLLSLIEVLAILLLFCCFGN